MERLDPMVERERAACVRYLRAEAERLREQRTLPGATVMRLSFEASALGRAADEIEKGAEEHYFGDGD